MHYHLNRTTFYHQLLSAIQVETNTGELPSAVLDSGVIAEESSSTPPANLSESSDSAKEFKN